jgi:hypothetical protein
MGVAVMPNHGNRKGWARGALSMAVRAVGPNGIALGAAMSAKTWGAAGRWWLVRLESVGVPFSRGMDVAVGAADVNQSLRAWAVGHRVAAS